MYIIVLPVIVAGLIVTAKYNVWWQAFGLALVPLGFWTLSKSWQNLKSYIDDGDLTSRNDGLLFLAIAVFAFTGTTLFTIL